MSGHTNFWSDIIKVAYMWRSQVMVKSNYKNTNPYTLYRKYMCKKTNTGLHIKTILMEVSTIFKLNGHFDWPNGFWAAKLLTNVRWQTVKIVLW